MSEAEQIPLVQASGVGARSLQAAQEVDSPPLVKPAMALVADPHPASGAPLTASSEPSAAMSAMPSLVSIKLEPDGAAVSKNMTNFPNAELEHIKTIYTSPSTHHDLAATSSPSAAAVASPSEAKNSVSATGSPKGPISEAGGTVSGQVLAALSDVPTVQAPRPPVMPLNAAEPLTTHSAPKLPLRPSLNSIGATVGWPEFENLYSPLQLAQFQYQQHQLAQLQQYHALQLLQQHQAHQQQMQRQHHPTLFATPGTTPNGVETLSAALYAPTLAMYGGNAAYTTPEMTQGADEPSAEANNGRLASNVAFPASAAGPSSGGTTSLFSGSLASPAAGLSSPSTVLSTPTNSFVSPAASMASPATSLASPATSLSSAAASLSSPTTAPALLASPYSTPFHLNAYLQNHASYLAAQAAQAHLLGVATVGGSAASLSTVQALSSAQAAHALSPNAGLSPGLSATLPHASGPVPIPSSGAAPLQGPMSALSTAPLAGSSTSAPIFPSPGLLPSLLPSGPDTFARYGPSVATAGMRPHATEGHGPAGVRTDPAATSFPPSALPSLTSLAPHELLSASNPLLRPTKRLADPLGPFAESPYAALAQPSYASLGQSHTSSTSPHLPNAKTDRSSSDRSLRPSSPSNKLLPSHTSSKTRSHISTQTLGGLDGHPKRLADRPENTNLLASSHSPLLPSNSLQTHTSHHLPLHRETTSHHHSATPIGHPFDKSTGHPTSSASHEHNSSSFLFRNRSSSVSLQDMITAANNQSLSGAAGKERDRIPGLPPASSHATRISSLADEGLAWDAALCDLTGRFPDGALVNPSPEDWFHSWQLNRRVAAKWVTAVDPEVTNLLFDVSKFYACNFEGTFIEFMSPELPALSALNNFLRLVRSHAATSVDSDPSLVHVATSYFNCSSRKRAAPECAAKLNTQLWFDLNSLEFFESIEGAKKSNSKNLHSAACLACHKSRLPPSVSTLRIVDRLLAAGHPPTVVEDMVRAKAIAKTGRDATDGRLIATAGTIFNRQRKVRSEQSKGLATPHQTRRKTVGAPHTAAPSSPATSSPTSGNPALLLHLPLFSADSPLLGSSFQNSAVSSPATSARSSRGRASATTSHSTTSTTQATLGTSDDEEYSISTRNTARGDTTHTASTHATRSTTRSSSRRSTSITTTQTLQQHANAPAGHAMDMSISSPHSTSGSTSLFASSSSHSFTSPRGEPVSARTISGLDEDDDDSDIEALTRFRDIAHAQPSLSSRGSSPNQSQSPTSPTRDDPPAQVSPSSSKRRTLDSEPADSPIAKRFKLV